MTINEIIIPSEQEIQQNLGRGKDIRQNNPFGNLIALYPLKERLYGKEVQWHCFNIETQEELNVRASSLTSGKTKGTKTNFSKIVSENNKKRAKNLSNQRFGKLVALRPTEKRDNKRCVIWECQCDCGNIHYVSSNNLCFGNVQSCGCLTQSHGELQIETLLRDNNIEYKKEYSVTINDIKYRFDFAIMIQNQLQWLIEFDGEQHFNDKKHRLWKDTLADIQRRDNIKNTYCEHNNIPLIRIPYTHKNIKLEDLLLQSSAFLYKK